MVRDTGLDKTAAAVARGMAQMRPRLLAGLACCLLLAGPAPAHAQNSGSDAGAGASRPRSSASATAWAWCTA